MNSARNLYRNEIDFAALALQDAGFNKHVKTNGQVNFSDPEAVKALTQALLKRDFKLSLSLPDDRLCPPVPNRLNYVLWLQDLIDQTSPSSFDDAYDEARDVTGLDIGTGASAIYPLLATTLRSRWRMYASELDEQNHVHAARNIQANNLTSRIQLLARRGAADPLIPLSSLPVGRLDFVMTNPPFYASAAEQGASAAAKSRPANSACTGAAVEMVYGDGGEVGFVRRLVDESSRLRGAVQWYSSMLGKLASVAEVVAELRARRCANWCVAELVQGQRTRRWAVAWSWAPRRPRNDVARNAGPGVERKWLPWPAEVLLPPAPGVRAAEAASRIARRLEGLQVRWGWKDAGTPGQGSGLVFAEGNVWSRAARRRRRAGAGAGEAMDMDGGGGGGGGDGGGGDGSGSGLDEPALVVRIHVRAGRADADADAEVAVRWLTGHDSVLFESFCGMLKRCLVGA